MPYRACLFPALAALACATAELPYALPTLQQVPVRPKFATSDVARQAWELYQNVSARQIARRALPEDALSEVIGAIASRRESTYRVSWISNARPEVLYDVEVGIGAEPRVTVSRHAPPIPLQVEDARQFLAHAAWSKELRSLEVCSQDNEIVTIHGDVNGWVSYFIPMPDTPGFMQIGGFHVLELDESGGTVLTKRFSSRPCSGWKVPSDSIAFTITEQQPRTPDVIDVYNSLVWQIPIYLSNTRTDTIWAVDDSGVRDVTSDFRKPDGSFRR